MKANRFINGKWVCHPIVMADLFFPINCPRKVCIVLSNQDYSFVKDSKELRDDVYSAIHRHYPDCEIDCFEILDCDFRMIDAL